MENTRVKKRDMIIWLCILPFVVIGVIIWFATFNDNGSAQKTSPKVSFFEEQVEAEEQSKRQSEVQYVRSNVGDTIIRTLPGDVKMELKLIKAGRFTMGSPESEKGWTGEHYTDEKQHTVTLTKDFYMGVTEVTQGQWQAIMGTTIDDQRKKERALLFGEGKDYPMYYVNWHETMEFCERLNEYAPAGWKFTLPTETQWEFACRAGSKSAYSWGDSLNGDKANCNGNYPYNTSIEGKYIGKTTPVKSYAPNAWGLYDMHGNVMEWCLDNYTSDLSNVKAEFTRNYRDSDGSRRVIRGGSWFNTAVNCRSASRSGWNPDIRRDYVGFRVALVRAD